MGIKLVDVEEILGLMEEINERLESLETSLSVSFATERNKLWTNQHHMVDSASMKINETDFRWLMMQHQNPELRDIDKNRNTILSMKPKLGY
ncbi:MULTISPECIES: hypothetical protein [Bacillaceae]|uniref:Uncharacterized protein n=1 Tax=Peribacillus huizhouensis TaxID=1501239 RepID=A0ABR6CS32_9BACI|nr:MULTISPECIES: hypothetical protein [Bacillaceae]MBA9027770.1 hypothetical protein [Peribacillus huizhouensis]